MLANECRQQTHAKTKAFAKGSSLKKLVVYSVHDLSADLRRHG